LPLLGGPARSFSPPEIPGAQPHQECDDCGDDGESHRSALQLVSFSIPGSDGLAAMEPEHDDELCERQQQPDDEPS